MPINLDLSRDAYRIQIKAHGGRYKGPENYHHLINKIGHRLTQKSSKPHLNWKFTVINSKKRVAWCLPGGKIAVSSGMIKRLEKKKDMLAYVLAHEISHVVANHGMFNFEFGRALRGLLSLIQKVVQFFFGKRRKIDAFFFRGYEYLWKMKVFSGIYFQELEADKASIPLLIKAGYNPSGAVRFQKLHAIHEPRFTYFNEFRRFLQNHHPSGAYRAYLLARA